MRMRPCLSLAGLLVLLLVRTAEANQPPGPHLLLAEVALLPLLLLLSGIGGAYAVLRALPGHRRGRSLLRWAGAVLAILVSGANEGIALLVAVGFGVLGFVRGIRMVRWGLGARVAARPPHLLAAHPGRLIPAGIVLAGMTAALVGMSVTFTGYWPGSDGPRVRALRDFVAYELAVARRDQAQTGQVRFHRIATALPGGRCPVRLPAGAQVEYAPDGTGFTVLLRARTAFPMFPYNYLTTQASHRADSSGQIRMVAVHDRETACPPDAPVVARVSEEEITRMQRLLEGSGECP
jgi:hypothetical protein